jgi:hypothetical protein
MTEVRTAPARRDETENSAPTRLKARVIIPVWGAKYVERLGAACLPALLAPGNLPHLARHFDCELVIVTESRLFDAIRALEPIERAKQWCDLRLVAMDDVMSHPSYYGLTITHSLYRGFTDLGEDAKNVWCLFLNADFILADGSYRTLVKRIQAGARCILAPSYCTVDETAMPQLRERAAANGGVLALPPREMAGIILDNRHFTIRAKTINWRMYRIEHVDQFYYVHDRDTLLARQIPIAVVAFRPQRVPAQPVTFWDYGVLSEVCPDAELCVLGDSDDFLMLELRAQGGMGDWLKLGWLDKDEIANHLSQWSTRDQRRCGAYTLTLHRGDLPANLEDGIQALELYYRDVERRLAPEPRDHQNHYIWTTVQDCHKVWQSSRGGARAPSGAPAVQVVSQRSLFRLTASLAKELARSFARGGGSSAYRRLHDIFRAGYRRLYGQLPDAGVFHPCRSDLVHVVSHLRDSAARSQRALSVCSIAGSAVASQLSQWFPEVVTTTPEEVLNDRSLQALAQDGPFDVCFLELTRDEFFAFSQMHQRLRALMRPKAEIIALYRTRGFDRVSQRDLALIYRGLPGSDLPELEFKGGWLSYYVQAIWESEQTAAQRGNISGLLRFAAVALALGPFAMIANWLSARHQPGRFISPCTSLLLRVTVI